jgi:hypothetical protein
LFYVFYNGWTVGSATFCATATLIGSIYGVPNQPDNVGAAFTILYYVYGISLFTAIIGAIIGSMITRAPLISAQARRKIAQMEQPEDLDGDGEIGLNDYCSFLRVRFLEAIGWEEYQMNYLVTLAALTWVFLGVLYGVYVEQWGFDHSLYFAMNAVSMAALADPPCEDGEPDHCDVGFYRGIAMSVYLLVGVPLFTLALAQLAGLVINKAVRENEYKIIHQPLTQDEYNYAANLYGNDEVLSLGEFTVLELLRLQRVSMEDLEHIKNLFCAIDEAETGMVDKPMLAKRNLLHHYGSVSPEGDRAAEVLLSARGRARTGSNASSRDAQSRRTRSRSRSLSSYNNSSRRGRDRDSPPLVKIPSVIFDEEATSGEQRSDAPGAAREEGEGAGTDDYEEGSSLGAPEIPASIKRMTFKQYNKKVVPLAFTTLIENYEEEGALDEEESVDDADELSSHGFNTAAEDEEDADWPVDSSTKYTHLGAREGGGGGTSQFSATVPPVTRFANTGPTVGFWSKAADSEREEEDEDLELAAIANERIKRERSRRLASKKSRTPSRRKVGSGSGREGRDASDAEKGYKSEV